MTIRKVDSPVVPPSLPQVQTARPANVAANVPTGTPSAFDAGVRGPTDLQRAETPASHVPLATMSLGTPARAASGPLPLDSAAAKAAIEKSIAYLNSQQGAGRSFDDAAKAFKPRAVVQDNLGMTHVRLDRTVDGVKVFGEQIISSLDARSEVVGLSGDSNAIPPGLAEGGKLTAADALKIAKADFNQSLERAPTVERVIAQDPDGNYRAAYHVELTNNFGGEIARRQNYLIDANTGEKFDFWNQSDNTGGEIAHHNEAVAKAAAAAAAAPIEVRKAAEPKLAISDLQTVTSTLEVGEDVTLDEVSLDLNIPHTWSGDLKVSLVSPSGKEVVVQDRQGGSKDDVTGSFDLSEAFKGEEAKGTWTLKVEDKAKRDTGTLQSWGLNLKGQGKAPPPPPPAAGDDQSIYSGKVDLQTTKGADGQYTLDDTSRGKGVTTLDAENKSRPSNPVAFKDENDTWGEAGENPRNKAAVDAQYGAQMTYDFLKDVLGRDSIDGKGEKLISNVHIGNKYVNAFWDGKQMNYGDGDGKNASELTTLDIAGHEIAHGLTERTAGLIYRNESGGLNEAMSDILGNGVEWYASQKNPDAKFSWGVGEQAWTPANGTDDALRYMDDPLKDGYSIDHYSLMGKYKPGQDNGGVHGSSGIANNAFYLLTQGGKNKTSGIDVQDGIGMDKSLKIFGRALENYMTPNTNFSQGRDATVRAAIDLFGANSPEVAKVREAWTAVGVNGTL